MSIEERLLTYKKTCFLEPEEDRIQETVRKSQACFYQRE